MYMCPKCRGHNVTVIRQVTMIETWRGDDVDAEEDLTYEREEERSQIRCDDCGCEDDRSDLWWCPF